MSHLLVVDARHEWLHGIRDLPTVTPEQYLAGEAPCRERALRVINLSNDYRYQHLGYYVSLVAEARRQRVTPMVGTIQDFRLAGVTRILSDDIDTLIRQRLKPLKSDTFELSIYFGRNLARRYDDLARRLWSLFPAPLMRARFRRRGDEWQLSRIRLLTPGDVPEGHREFVVEALQDYLRAPKRRARRRPARYDLAIYVDKEDPTPPSNPEALRHFSRAFEECGFLCDIIGNDDIDEIGKYDALFLRATTNVNHRTYTLARRAEAEGLVVIDDPLSILYCTNKVFLAELLRASRIPAPRTHIITRGNLNSVATELSYPAVIKQPDSAFSLGVFRCDSPGQLIERGRQLLDASDLLVVQEFTPTTFDWRIGLIDRAPFYACRYYMAGEHWQIALHEGDRTVEGDSEGVPIAAVPGEVLRVATRAAGLIGDGLYGVDVKQIGDRVLVVEVNDNPSIDAGVEDEAAGLDLYMTVARSFLRRVENRGRRA